MAAFYQSGLGGSYSPVVDATTGRFALGGYEQGYTGIRDITSFIEPSHSADKLYLSRSGNVVEFIGRNVSLVTTGVVLLSTNPIPAGFRPKYTYQVSASTGATYSSATTRSQVAILSSGVVQMAGLTGLYFYGTFITPDAWPVTRPGIAG